MKYDTFILYYYNIGPKNTIINLREGYKVRLINQEVTGFIPKEQIRTKFYVYQGIDFDFLDNDIESKDQRQ